MIKKSLTKEELTELIDILKCFCIREFGDSEDLEVTNPKKTPIMYTHYSHIEEVPEGIKVEVFVNLIEYRIWTTYNEIKVYEEKYDNYEEFKEMLDYLDFDTWTSLDQLKKFLKFMGDINENKKKGRFKC